MRNSSLKKIRGCLLAAVFLGPAAALWAPSTPAWGEEFYYDPEISMQRGREAYFHRRYAESLSLFLEVLLDNPSHAEAKRMLKDAAKAAADEDIGQIQAERKVLLENVKKTDRTPASEKNRPEPIKTNENLSLQEFAQSLGEIQAASGSIEIASAQTTAAAPPEVRRKKVELPESQPRKTSSVQESPKDAEKEFTELYLSGLILYSRGKLAEAGAAWERALAIKPEDEKAQRALARVRKEEGNL